MNKELETLLATDRRERISPQCDIQQLQRQVKQRREEQRRNRLLVLMWLPLAALLVAHVALAMLPAEQQQLAAATPAEEYVAEMNIYADLIIDKI